MAEPTPHIRLAEPADIPALRALIFASVRALQTGEYTPEQREGAIGFAFDVDPQLIDDRHYFLAEIEGEIAACGGWSDRQKVHGGDPQPHSADHHLDPLTDSARIRAIFVHPSHARKGLGTLILRHCEDEAAAAGFRTFQMGSTLTGVPLYRRYGYREDETIFVPLPNGASLPIVRMTKSL